LSTLARDVRTAAVRKAVWLVVHLALAFAGVAGCRASSPAGGVEAACARACEAQAKQCSTEQCGRGCNLVLDRLAERQGPRVLACVAAAPPACDDRAWARCATRIGAHADGGPPAPPPASTVEPEGEGD
jgi:hypothetical protein